MAWDDALPFGVRDTHVRGYTTQGATTLDAASLNVPNGRTISFSESEDYEELRGDDKVVAIVGLGPSVEWEMESGGISTPAYKKINGGTVSTTGTTPAQITTYYKKVTDIRPYFQAEGQSMSDMGGDFHVVLCRCRASGSVDGELADGAFWLTACNGVALPSLVVAELDYLYKFVLNETATAITP